MNENEIIGRILSDAKIGWWKADFKRRTYIFSDYFRDLLGFSQSEIPFEEFIGYVRPEFRDRLRSEFDTYANQFIYDRSIPVRTPKGEIWIRAKVIDRITQEDGSVIHIGYAQIVPGEDIPENEESVLRTNDLLYQLNSISHTLLSFLHAESVDEIIRKILGDILKLFKGGRAYIIEYDLENKTQTCTYEVADKNVSQEQGRIDHLPMADTPWWTRQVCTGQSIILSDLDNLPSEAAVEKEFLSVQNIKSLIVVPLIAKDGVWGYVGIDIVEEAHRWTNEDCQWFSSLANVINICMELQKSEQEASKERTYLRGLYQHMPVGYLRLKMLYDRQGNLSDYIFLDANDATERIVWNCEKEDYIGFRASEKGRNLSVELPVLAQVLHSEQYIDMTDYMKDACKYVRTIMYSTQKDEVICLMSDMTEIYEAHQALDRSEKILRNIYDNLPAGVELYNKEGLLIDLNNKDMEIFGVKDKETTLGVDFFSNPNVPEDIKEKVRNRENVSFKLVYPFDHIGDYYSCQKTGSIEIYTTVSMLYDSQGELINFMLINMDNTEINRAHSRIAEFESSFSMVCRFGKVGYCRFDLLTKEGYGVPQWYHNLGEKEDTPLREVLGVYNHVHPDDKSYLMECIRRVKLGEIDNFTADLQISTPQGNKWTRVNVMRNMLNTDPSKLEMVCVNYDITELKRTEKNLIEAKNRAEVSDRLKSAFLANMSHEIRTPLNAIVGFSNLLVEAEDAEEKKEYISIVQENNDLLLKLISDILDLSKIEAGTFEFVNGEVDVNQLCTEIIRSLGMKAADTGVELRFGEHLPQCRMISDKNRLMQLISNFINNALKFTAEGSITLGYRLEPKKEILFYVRDTGTGIPPDQQQAIFDRFVKLNSFVQGTGLGLSICKSIVEQMGGRIGVESKEGEGSTFWFSVPFVEGAYESEMESNMIESGSCLTGHSDENRPTVLIAEDTDSNYLLLFLLLKKEYHIVRALNGLEAVEMHEKLHPDIILMDVKMPEMDGLQATREIRKKDTAVPIIAITAFAFDQDKQRTLEAGCNDYMSKPVQGALLREKMQQFLRGDKG